jgi:GTP cyclohydrolase I
MEMRGVSRPALTTTTAFRGSLEDERLQQQFFAQLRTSRTTSSPLEA